MKLLQSSGKSCQSPGCNRKIPGRLGIVRAASISRPNGTVTAAGGLSYLWQAGATELPNLPGLVPAGLRSPRHYGAMGDGVTNDIVAMLAALNSGKGIDGEDLTYGISGSCEPVPAKLGLANARLKQLTPNATTRTLSLLNVPLWFFSNVSIDMGGFITAGNTQDANGLRINGGSGVITRVLVENGGPSSGLAVLNAGNVTIEDCTVKGMAWTLTGVTDDILQEFWISTCTNVTVSNCRAEAVTGINNGVATVKYSRGFAIAGCSNLEVTNCRADGVDQGYDTSGSGQNNNFIFTGNHATTIGTWGFKFANAGLCGLVANCIGRNCGAAAFVCSGGENLGAILNTQRISFTGCRAVDPGSNGIWSEPKGFQVVGRDPLTGPGAGSLSYPQFITHSNCHVSDLTAVPRLAYGFYSDVVLAAGAAPGITADALCGSTGQLMAEFFGVNRPRDAYDASGNHVYAGNLRTNENLSAGKLLSLDRQNLTLANGDNNNVSGYYSYSRINGPAAAFAISGFAAPLAEGALLILHKVVTQQLTLKHASGLSTAGNRIRTMSGSDLVLPAGERHTVWLYYDGAESIWMVTGWTSAGGGGGASAWGAITGTLSAQTDLQAALEAKEAAGAVAAHVALADPHPQ